MKILLVAGCLFLAGCGLRNPAPTTVLMIDPTNGQPAECRARLIYEPGLPAIGPAPAVPGGSYYSRRSLDECVQQYEAAGFLRAETWRNLQQTSRVTGYPMKEVLENHKAILERPMKTEPGVNNRGFEEYRRSGELTHDLLVAIKECESRNLRPSPEGCVK